MGAGTLSNRVRVLLGVVAASVLLALASPATALAANTASFSSVSPASGSYSMANTPKISVRVYDRYGIYGSGSYSMTLDGRKVAASRVFIVSGAWNPRNPDYRRIRLTYQVPASLSVGTHTVTVKIKDRRKRYSTYTWKFNVDDATDPVTFTALTPEIGSRSDVTKPRISATVASRWDVKGTAGYSMTLDGANVAESIAYTTAGKYRNFKVFYQVPTALAPGAHQVVLTILDAAKRTTTKSWTFTVTPPVPVYAEMPVEGASCGDCHSSYPAAHPMTACSSCHGAGKPVPGRTYSPWDQSAHTLSCSLDCHGRPNVGPYPHMLSADCSNCHSPSFPNIPQTHEIDASAIKAAHAAPASFCTTTFCHSSSLTAEHYRSGVNRETLTCGGCHESTKPLVVAAIAGGLTSCESCHDLRTLVHPDTASAHAAVGSCVRTGCHVTDVAAVHKQDCSKCHAAGIDATTNCATCHGASAPAGPYHLGAPAAHALSENGCVTSGCHGVGLGMDASLTHGTACTACHGSESGASLECVTCHDEALLVLHEEEADHHVAPALFCTTSDCHGSDVAATHYKDGAARCIACHGSGKTPSTLCTNCHAGDELEVHEDATQAHTITGDRCVTAGCHAESDAALLHREGGVGCSVCHSSGNTPNLDCETSCHAGGLEYIHSDAAGNHVSTNTTCVRAACHVADVTNADKNHDRCTACHGRPTPLSADCQNCHAGDLLNLHPNAEPFHTAPAGFCESGCHSNDVAEIHSAGVDCVACHNSQDVPSTLCSDCHDDTPNEVHPWAIAGHVSYFDGGCLIAGCHPSDVTATHVKDGSPRCVACHATGVDASVKGTDCDNCHAGDITSLHPGSAAAHTVPETSDCLGAPCHATNVGTIHAPSASGCAACHDGVRVLTGIDCATVGCHVGDPEWLHRRGDSGHVAAPSGCVSLACHVTDVSTLHAPGPSCLACHAAGVDPSIKGTTCARVGCHPGDLTSRHAERAGTDHNAPSGTCVQDGCHGTNAGVNVATLHKDGLGCISCHSDVATASLDCGSCHPTDLNTVHTRGNAYHTAPSTSCDQGNGGLCHGRDVIALHGAEGGPKCAACHAPDKNPSARCADCHSGSFWGGIHVLTDPAQHDPVNGTCVTSTCHSTDVANIHTTAAPTSGPGCAPCHRQGQLTIDCQECHTVDMTPRHSAADADHGLLPGVCANDDCHGTDTGANVATLHADLGSSCATCHRDGQPATKICSTCHGPEGPLEYHTGLPAMHIASAGTCVSDGCHGTTADGVNVATLHARTPEAITCPACHGPGIDPTTDCDASGCHASSPSAVHNAYIVVDGVDKHAKVTNTCSAAHCHVGSTLTAVHGPTNCSPCHGEGKTPAADCATSGCHYDGSFPLIHTTGNAPHAVVEGTCVSIQCHNLAVDAIHSQAKGPRCVACHAVNAGHATTASCETCHSNATKPGQLPTPDSTPTAHPTATAADSTHTVDATGCTRTGCHSTNLAAIHAVVNEAHPVAPKCAACHASNKLPSKVCANCHAADFAPPHPAPMPEHATPVLSCTKVGCHVQTSVALIHVRDGVGRCIACHIDGAELTLTCTEARCHGTGAFPPTHPAPEAIHLSSDNCTTGCHQTSPGKADVSKIHVTADTVKHCGACHTGTGQAVKTCASCHTTGTFHLEAAVSHAVGGDSIACTGAGCHSTDVSLIHVRAGVDKCLQACHSAADPAIKGTTCSNCHSITSGHPHPACDGCHAAGGGNHYGYGTSPIAGRACTNCHGTPFQPLTWNGNWGHQGCNEHCHTESSCDCH